MKKLNKKGFTLVELLAVIVILALLMVVIGSIAGNIQDNAKKTALETEAKKIFNGLSSEAKSYALLKDITSDSDELKAIQGSYNGKDGDEFTYKATIDKTGSITIFAICYLEKYEVTYDTSAKKLKDVTTKDSSTECTGGVSLSS